MKACDAKIKKAEEVGASGSASLGPKAQSARHLEGSEHAKRAMQKLKK